MCILINMYENSWDVFFNIINQSYSKWKSPWEKHKASKSEEYFYNLLPFIFCFPNLPQNISSSWPFILHKILSGQKNKVFPGIARSESINTKMDRIDDIKILNVNRARNQTNKAQLKDRLQSGVKCSKQKRESVKFLHL